VRLPRSSARRKRAYGEPCDVTNGRSHVPRVAVSWLAMSKRKRQAHVPGLRSQRQAYAGTGTTTVHAISVEGHVLQSRGLRFEPPESVRRTDPKGCRYWWGLLEFAFDVEDPAAFPPLKGAAAAN
jgi:hypothetical protein